MLRLFNLIASRVSVGAAWSVFSWGLPLAALLAGAAGGGWAAWELGRAPLRTELAELRVSHSETTRLVQQAGARRLQVAQEHSESLAAELAATLATHAQLTEDKAHALRTATTGRACLSDRALRVLHGAPGITVAGAAGLPAPRPGAAAPGAPAAAPAHADSARPQPPAAAPGLETTDTAVALWIATAGQQYEACRARLSALIAWHQPATTTATQEPPREPAP